MYIAQKIIRNSYSTKTVTPYPTMYCIRKVVIVCLLAYFAECDDNLLQHGIKQSSEIHHRQLNIFSGTQTKQICVKCTIPPKNKLDGLAKAIENLNPIVTNAYTLIGGVHANILRSVNSTKLAIKTLLRDVKVDIEPVLDELQKSVANITNCPSLKSLCGTLQINVIALLNDFQTFYPKLLLETNLEYMQDSLLESMSHMVGNYFQICSDLLYYILELFSFELCNSVGIVVVRYLLDPNGEVAKGLAELLRNSSKRGIKKLLQTLYEVAVPGESPATLNIFEIISQVLCILVSGLHLDKIGGSKCPIEPPGGSVHPLAAVKGLACSVMNQLLNLTGLSSMSVKPPLFTRLCTDIL